MASIPTQEEILAATRKSQEAMITVIKAWLETVRTATPKLTFAYAPLTGKLPKLPSVSLPFADKLPTPGEAVDNAYHMAEQLLANQRKFTEDVVKAMTPLVSGRSETAPKGNGSGEPKIPGPRAWQEAVAVSEPKPTAVSEPKPVAFSEPKPAAVSEPKPVVASEPKTTTSAAPKAPVRPSAKSTPARPAPRTTARAAKSTASRTTTAKSTAAKSASVKSASVKSTAAKSTPNTTPGSPAPKGPDAS